ncbi:MAG: ABC transporter permease [Ginsengibacter sp.]
MRTIRFLLQKEFRQIFRNKAILALIMVMPVIQLLILPLAADYEVKGINIVVVDNDHSTYSSKMIRDITSSGYFHLIGYRPGYKEAFHLLEQDEADIILEIPNGFERNLYREDQQKLFIAVNSINGSKAIIGSSYLQSIVKTFNNSIRLKWAASSQFDDSPAIEVVSANWYNPFLSYKIFMVPGILALLVTMIGGFLSALNIVKEKEAGTIEQINVTPIRKHLFILGKLIPFWVLGLMVFAMGLLVARIVYGVVPLGNLLVLFGFVAMYLLAVLGFGLLVSTYCDTQQQAMLIMFFFMMIFILMGGLFTSIDSMPGWARAVTKFNPVSYLIMVMRMVILKGSTWKNVLPYFGIIAVFAAVLNTWAILNYKKTS